MQRERIFNDIPPVIVVLALLIGGVELIMQLATNGVIGGQYGVGWRAATIDDFAVFPAVIDQITQHGDFRFSYLVRLVTFPFIHSSLNHAVFALIILVALGKFVGERWHAGALLTVFFVSAIVTAVFFGLVAPQNWPFYGAYPPVYGLIGAFSYLLWVRLGQTGGKRWRAFSLIAMLLLVQILWGLMLKIMSALGFAAGDPTSIFLYVGLSEVAGFVTGFILSPVLGPGGWNTFVSHIRQR